MPRVSRAQTEANHQAIEDAASRLFRERGIDAVTVAEVMAEAGLTHGGFYSHYESKDQLAASACKAAFAVAAEKWRRRVDAAPSKTAARDAITEGYLRDEHGDPAKATCPTATLAADVARASSDHPIHAEYIDGVREQVALLADLHGSGDRAAACVQLSTMMGAILLARATNGDPISHEFLKAARAHLKKRSRR